MEDTTNLKDKEMPSGSYLSKKGYVIKKDSITNEELVILRSQLRARPLQDDKYNTFNQTDTSYPIYTETKNKIYIPKMYGINRYGDPKRYMPNYIGKSWENLDLNFNGTLFDNQIEPVNALLSACKQSGGGILKAGTGSGKCMKIDTEILMFDGSIKMVQDIVVGELLMGDDSTPRKVLSLARGQDLMYEIIPVKGESYTVNQEHILCLRASSYPYFNHSGQGNTRTCFVVKWLENNKFCSKYFRYNKNNKNEKKKEANDLFNWVLITHPEQILEISVKDYIKLSNKKKHILKGYKVSIEFPEKQLQLDPYMIGFWLGDGTTSQPEITTQDSTIIKYFKENLQQYKCYLQYINNKSDNNYKYRINGDGSGVIKSNTFMNELNNQNLIGNKHIPMIYKCNSRENRLKLLAGLIDSDGSLNSGGCYDFIQKSEKLIDDVIYLARSLGFACYKSKQKKGCWYLAEYKEDDYYRISISGNINEIPVLCPRKRANQRRQIKNVLNTGITVKQLDTDNYYGFEIDGNSRYVLGDFTVTHNTFMSINVLSELKTKTIVVVNKIPLMRQWESELRRFIPNIEIGFIQGQKNVSVEGKDVVIAMLQSLARVDYPDSLFDDFGLVIVDECFPYDTCIITSNGNINIGHLYYMKTKCEKLPMVKTFNEITKQFEYKKIINVFRKQNDTLIEIHCSKMNMKSTENHKYLTYNGWKEAKELSIYDYIVSNYDKNTINSVCPALNEDQYQIVLGSFLGDGHIGLLKNGRYRLSMTHGKQQYDYCKWKANMFNVNDIRYIEKNGYSQKQAYHFATKTFYLFNSLPTTKTDVPQWILNDLDERGLAIWFMDDGSLNRKSFYSTISTDSFNEDSQKRIVLKLKSMNIDCKYINYKKSYYHIVINANGTKELIRIIRKYIHNSMLYKLLPQQYLNYIQDTSVKILDENTIFCSKENIKKEFLSENQIYKIYKNNNKNEIYDVKYLHCKKCNDMTFHSKNITNIYEYWKCNHTSKDILQNLPIVFGEYNWNNKFLDYGYSKITKITKNIKNFSKSKFKRNYVFDLEIEDNHNYIVKKSKSKDNIENGFVVHNCHNTSSRVFSQVLSKLCCKYTIGLSATPKRSDGCEYVFKYHIGDIVYASDTKRSGLPPVLNIIRIDSSEYKEINTVNRITGQSQIQYTSMLSDLITMPKRNRLILEMIKDLVLTDNRKILVLSDRREHLKSLKQDFDDDLNISFTYGLFLGQMKQKDLEITRASQVIFATFSAFGEGVSEKELDTLFLITPKKFIGHLKNSIKAESGKLEQIVGRIFRKDHTCKNPMIIDLQDHFSVYKNQSAQRRTFYKQHFKNSITCNNTINLDEYELENLNVKCIRQTRKIKTVDESECQTTNELQLLKHCVIDD